MCHTGSVHGSAVTLDVSYAADGNFSSCNCTVSSNFRGFNMNFTSAPDSINCNNTVNMLFDDLSMQLRCGAPEGIQRSNGRGATIIYTMTDYTPSLDSTYCMTFYESKMIYSETNLTKEFAVTRIHHFVHNNDKLLVDNLVFVKFFACRTNRTLSQMPARSVMEN